MSEGDFVTVQHGFKAPINGKVVKLNPGDRVPLTVVRQQWPERTQRSLRNVGHIKEHLPPVISSGKRSRQKKG